MDEISISDGMDGGFVIPVDFAQAIAPVMKEWSESTDPEQRAAAGRMYHDFFVVPPLPIPSGARAVPAPQWAMAIAVDIAERLGRRAPVVLAWAKWSRPRSSSRGYRRAEQILVVQGGDRQEQKWALLYVLAYWVRYSGKKDPAFYGELVALFTRYGVTKRYALARLPSGERFLRAAYRRRARAGRS